MVLVVILYSHQSFKLSLILFFLFDFVVNVATIFFFGIYGREDVVPTVFVDESFSDLWPTLCNRICWWHSPPLSVQLRYDRISSPPFFLLWECLPISFSLPKTTPMISFIIIQNMLLCLIESLIFCFATQKWRRRWFVLKHSGELPGQYFLEYYTDRTCRKLKGKIDLDQCEQVIVCAKFSLFVSLP